MYFTGPINQLGMGIHFTGYAAAYLRMCPPDVRMISRVFPKGKICTDNPITADQKLLVAASNSDYRHILAPRRVINMALWHMKELRELPGGCKYLYTVFETDLVPLPYLQEISEAIDVILVPTDWHRFRLELCLREAGYRTPIIMVIPGGVDQNVYNLEVGHSRSWPDQKTDEVKLLSIGKLEKRKGMDVLLDALSILSSKVKRPVRLIAHWANQFIPTWLDDASRMCEARGFTPMPSVSNLKRFSKDKITIDLITGWFTNRESLKILYATADWFVSPSFGEGWGLPMHEAAACGIPLISATENGFPSVMRVVYAEAIKPLEGRWVLAKDDIFFHGNVGNWYQISTDSLVSALDSAIEGTGGKLYHNRRLSASRCGTEYNWDYAASLTKQKLVHSGYSWF